MKPTIFFFGNCHMGVARNALGRIGMLTDEHELVFIRHDIDASNWNEEIVPGLQRCAVFVEQVHSDGAELRAAVHRLLPANCRRITLAPSFLNSLWPFVANDPRNAHRQVPLVGETYPKYVCNRFILQYLNQGDSPDSAWRRYMDLDIERVVDLDRLHEIGLAQLRALERGKDIVLAGHIAANFASQRLFLLQVHPAGGLFAELCRQLLAALGVAPSPAVQALLDELRAFHGVGAYDAPIHPRVAAHFGLTWAKDLRYRHFHEGDFSHEEQAARYARFDFCSIYYRGLQAWRLGRKPDALRLLRAGVDANPGSRYMVRSFARLAMELGQVEDAIAVLDRAFSEHGVQDGELWLGVAQATFTLGNHDLSERAAERAIALGAEPAEAWRLRSLSLGHQGRVAEASQASRRSQWFRAQPARRPLVEEWGAEYGRHWLRWDEHGF